jgi:hypothetical protein
MPYRAIVLACDPFRRAAGMSDGVFFANAYAGLFLDDDIKLPFSLSAKICLGNNYRI